MSAYFQPRTTAQGDYEATRLNGAWYLSWMSGYEDILKRGVPKPRNRRTVLAELHSPIVPDFLHGWGAAEVPFLVTTRVRRLIEIEGLRGFSFAPVQVAKIATLGKRSRVPKGGEPEDVISKARGVTAPNVPRLHAVYVTGTAEVVPKHLSGQTPWGTISPFEPKNSRIPFDIWVPVRAQETYAGYAFCSQRFADFCAKHALSNIEFNPFSEFMRRFGARPRRRM